MIELCGHDFEKIKKLKRKIIKKLRKWVTLEDYSKASYYKYTIKFSRQLQFPLRLFSLNYDLCLEKNSENCHIELGFDKNGRWQWQRFEKNENIPVNIYLYKMHGSINWERKDGFLTYSDEASQIREPDLIFGTSYKLQYVDPYLFFAYEFRKYSLEARLMITIGYGYGDEHINGIIGQALRHKKDMKVIANIYNAGDGDEIKENILKKIGVKNPSQLVVRNMKASDFLKSELNLKRLVEYLPQETPFDK